MNFNFLDGYKMHIAGAALMLVSLLEFVGIDVVNEITPGNALASFYAGWLVVSGRSALAKVGGSTPSA